MTEREYIDEVFRNALKNAGPSITASDEERFLMNLHQKKKRKGFFFWSILSAFFCVLAVSTMAWFISHQSSPHQGNSAVKNNATPIKNEYSPLLAAHENPALNNQPSVSLNSSQSSTHSPSFYTTMPVVYARENSNPFHKIIAPNSSIIYTDLIQSSLSIDAFSNPYLHFLSQSLPLSSLEWEFPGIKMVPMAYQYKNPFPPRKNPRYGLTFYAGLHTIAKASWKGFATPKSHIEFKDFVNGMRSTGLATHIGIRFTYPLTIIKNTHIGIGMEFQHQTFKTTYSQSIKNIPVIDTATGYIVGYIPLPPGITYSLPSTKGSLSRFTLPVLFKWEKTFGKNEWGIGAEASLNIWSKSINPTFDLNAFEKRTQKIQIATVNPAIYLSYGYAINKYKTVGIELKSFSLTAKQQMFAGAQQIKSYQIGIQPYYKIRF